MHEDSIKLTVDATINPSQKSDLPTGVPQYTRPVIYAMGRTGALLQGSGRHKRDDTGYPGFEVDQF